MKLTKAVIDRAEYPEGHTGRFLLMDDEVTNFGVRVYPSGRKAFVIRYRTVEGERRLLTLGEYGILTLQQGRELARMRLVDAIKGGDPLKERESLRESPTFGDLCEAYMERHAKPRKRTWKKDQQRLDRYVLPRWSASRKLDVISSGDVAALHHQIGETTPYEANRTLEVLRKMFNLAVRWGFLPSGWLNPAVGHDRFPEKKRDRWVTPNELPRLFDAIDVEDNVYVRAALRLFLFTGTRRSELLGTRWEHVDLARGVLYLPETKNGQSLSVPLSPTALEVIRALPRLDGNPFLLPGHIQGRHLVNMDKPWRRVCERAKLTDVRLHDLRRTVGSWLVEQGHSLLLVQKALGHKAYASTLVYARLSDATVRDAMEKVGDRMVAVGRGVDVVGGGARHEGEAEGRQST